MTTDTKTDKNSSILAEPIDELKVSKIKETLTDQKTQYYDDKNDTDNILDFEFPQYGVDEIINDVANWQRQLTNIGGEPGYFYFKIFFKFKTNYGLLADLLKEQSNQKQLSQGSAIFYLASIEHRYKHEQIPHRMLALYKFGSTLRSLQTETPWFFKGVNGLDKLNSQFLANIGKQQMLEIVCNTESVDMRLGTLLDLYKYACYDYANCKEIIPVNLRKFDMSIITYHMPLKLYNTHIIQSNQRNKKDRKNVESKTMYPTTGEINFSNVMSYKMYSFKNCEFDTETLDSYTPSSLSNETAFNMGGNTLKIKYDRVYEHRMNEWGQFMMGDTGFYYNEHAPESAIGTGNLTNVSGNSTPYVINTNNLNHQSTRLEFIKKRYEGNGNGFFTPKNTILDFGEWAIRDLDTKATSRITDLEIHTGRSGIGFLRHNTATLNRRLKKYKSSPFDILNKKDAVANMNIIDETNYSNVEASNKKREELFTSNIKSKYTIPPKKEKLNINKELLERFKNTKVNKASLPVIMVDGQIFLKADKVQPEAFVNANIYDRPGKVQPEASVNTNIYDKPDNVQPEAVVNTNIYDKPDKVQRDARVNTNIYDRPDKVQPEASVNTNIYDKPSEVQPSASVNTNIYDKPSEVQPEASVNTNIYDKPREVQRKASVNTNIYDKPNKEQ